MAAGHLPPAPLPLYTEILLPIVDVPDRGIEIALGS
jgi:hypothetical protein